jgi:hypothetical protein
MLNYVVGQLAEPNERDLTLAGKQVTVSWTITPPVVSPGLDLAGQALTLDLAVSPDVVDPGLDLAGQAPTLDLAVSPDVVDPGLDLTGQVPTVHWTITPPVVSPGLDLTGTILNYVVGQLAEPNERDLTLAGKQVTVSWTITPLVVSPGLDLTGQAPTLGSVTTPTERDLALDGKTPTAFREDTVSPDVLSPGLDLTGQAPTLDLAVAPAERDLTLAGKQPEIFSGLTISPDVVDPGLDLAGQAPEILAGHLAEPAARSLSLAGKQPEVPQESPEAFPLVGSLSLTGQTPVRKVVVNTDRLVPEADLTLTGKIAKRGVGLYLKPHAPDPAIAAGQSPFRFPAVGAAVLTGQDIFPLVTGPSSQTIEVPVRQLFTQTDGPALEIIDPSLPPSLTLNMMHPEAVVTDPIFYPASAALAFTAYIPLLSPTVLPGERGVTVAGQAVDPQQTDNKLLLPGEGGLTLSGNTPVVFSEPLALPDVGSLSLSAQAPSMSWSISVTKRPVTITGHQPDRTDFGQDFPVDPVRRILRIQNNDPPNVNVGHTASVGSRALAISGNAPGIDHETASERIPRLATLALSTSTVTIQVTRKIAIGDRRVLINPGGVSTTEKRFRKYGARTRFVRLTTRYSLEVLYR